MFTAAVFLPHQVKWMSPLGVLFPEVGGYWLCRDCGRRFDRWPSDSEACLGPDPLAEDRP